MFSTLVEFSAFLVVPFRPRKAGIRRGVQPCGEQIEEIGFTELPLQGSQCGQEVLRLLSFQVQVPQCCHHLREVEVEENKVSL